MSPAEYKTERKSRGLTQSQIAKLLGVRQSTVSGRECGYQEITMEAELAIKSLSLSGRCRELETDLDREIRRLDWILEADAETLCALDQWDRDNIDAELERLAEIDAKDQRDENQRDWERERDLT